ncbi:MULTISPECIES: EscU/YscU/HrcU family type III secretion system export apparatus switch protein [unclassified Sphingomonas]|uniref:EscU/YscU/HrcU family type III secretion system export apparatus switch protein n=1 Tax=unclassified Sphingomonas TaxID=196159 RepID=UPI0006F7D5E0|nr:MULTISPECIES: flagellar type III secretion system protein FlhB [unclassified Sphingomonas]KQM27668.1 flagellar biosynthesis protein FlhB [Sphingomonas sp. Leaf9]KQM44008.1 flagellar biosynthesis protein FlhB [Sphingomonas sp. Leaf11]KQM87459.1 flagellar biosynthesis protein FlhB [Sphingomonas sp. Leaf23]
MSEDKTESPTQKRLDKAREDGDVLKSKELGAALVILAGCAWLALLGPSLVGACKAIMTASFRFGRADVEDFQPWRPLIEAGWKLLPSLGGILALAVSASILAQAGLTGIRFNGGALAPKGSRINPASGMKRIFGTQGWIELGKSLLKVILLGAIGYVMLKKAAISSVGLVSSNVDQAVGDLGGTFLTLLFVMAGGLVLIAGLDVPLAIFQRMQRLQMTKQEVRDEHKESDGDPHVKAQIRQRRHDILKGGFKAAVGEAQVVLTNPTHFAVALRYDHGRDQVPVVVAKGRGATAMAIRELAAEAKIPMLEYPQLARAVYYTSKQGQEIRDDLYLAIATVLAFVMGVNRQAGGIQPPVTVPEEARYDENGNLAVKNP